MLVRWPEEGRRLASDRAKLVEVLRVENVLKEREKSLKNNCVKARADMDGSDLTM